MSIFSLYILDRLNISLISKLIMNRPSAGVAPVCLSYILIIILLFESTRPVQSIALSSLCGHFGHSCFGGKYLEKFSKKKI